MGQSTVRAALKRFERAGPAALRERPRSGRPAKVPP
jgi:transposase